MSLSAMGAATPARPGPFRNIPNFCRDCTRDFKRKMLKQDRCEFPDTRFSPSKSMGETEICGKFLVAARSIDKARQYAREADAKS